MATVRTAEQGPATPDEIWAILRETAQRQEDYARRQEEYARRQEEFELKWKQEAAQRQKEFELRWEQEAARRREEAEAEAAKRQEEAARRREEAEAEAAKRQEEAAKRQAEAARRREEAEAETAKREEERAKREEEFERKWARTEQMFKEVAERYKGTERMIKFNGEQIGGLHNGFGELVEHLVGPGIVQRFRERGYHFDGVKERRYVIPGRKPGKIKAEVDMLLENDDTIIAVEIKSRPDPDRDIAHHVRRLEALRKYRQAQGMEPKRILGAIAGAIFYDDAREATVAAGLFAIEQSGDTMWIDVPEGFVPREW